MNSHELKLETERLINLSDSLVNRVCHTENDYYDQLNQVAHGALALLFAFLTAWVASWFDIDKEFRHLIFGAQIILYGCLQIAAALTQNFAFYNKLLDNINASRVVMVDMANKLGYLADKS